MIEARRLIGTREIPGKVTAPIIATMLARLGAWWSDDETPWCATFVSWCLQSAGLAPPKAFYRGRAFIKWGIHVGPVAIAPYGSIVVLERTGGHHVGFLTGVDTAARTIHLLGGNQDNRVNFSPYDIRRVVAVRSPEAVHAIMGIRCPDWRYYPGSSLGGSTK